MMSYVRHYIMQAGAGRADELRESLSALAVAVRQFPGSLGVELLCDLDRRETFYFIERWDNEECQRAAGALLPKDVMKRMSAAMAGAPVAANLCPVTTEP